jgi:hypothetical protein
MGENQWEVTEELKAKMRLMDNPELDPADVEEVDHDDSK